MSNEAIKEAEWLASGDARVRDPVWMAKRLELTADIFREVIADRDSLRDALAALVTAKDMKDRLRRLHEMGRGTDYAEYERLKHEAWEMARHVLRSKRA